MKRIVLGLLLGSIIGVVNARDLGQWDAVDPAVREWYQALMQPDVPTASCCGEADAYWADEVHVRDGKTYATITDDRPDAPRQRPHIEIGNPQQQAQMGQVKSDRARRRLFEPGWLRFLLRSARRRLRRSGLLGAA
jgi:hypothetical protein